MIACDVNVLVYAYNEDGPQHHEYRAWLDQVANGPEPLGLPSPVISGFARIMTHPKLLTTPLTSAAAFDLLGELRTAPAVVEMTPGPRHPDLFENLCRATSARGNAIPDAYLAALAIEHGARWLSADRGFARYPGLRSAHPLD